MRTYLELRPPSPKMSPTREQVVPKVMGLCMQLRTGTFHVAQEVRASASPSQDSHHPVSCCMLHWKQEVSAKRSFNLFQNTGSWLPLTFLGLHPHAWSGPLCQSCRGAGKVFKNVSYMYVSPNAHDPLLGRAALKLSPKKAYRNPSRPEGPSHHRPFRGAPRHPSSLPP